MKSVPWTIEELDGVTVRKVNLHLGLKGKAWKLLHLSDIHFNAINDRDREENHELVMWSYQDLSWLRDGVSVSRMQKCISHAGNVDQLVVTGDSMSYLSYGNLELMKKYIFDPYPDALVCIGNHDALRCWNCKIDDAATLPERLEVLQQNWLHDIYYTSKVLNERVMLIQLDNASHFDYGNPGFSECQIEPFRQDLALAREKGYAVLLFYHVPLKTNDKRYEKTAPCGKRGDVSNFYEPTCDGKEVALCNQGAPREVYHLIEENADLIKGCFCGHMHGDYYTEIKITDEKGKATYIPQYILTANPYDGGSYSLITIT